MKAAFLLLFAWAGADATADYESSIDSLQKETNTLILSLIETRDGIKELDAGDQDRFSAIRTRVSLLESLAKSTKEGESLRNRTDKIKSDLDKQIKRLEELRSQITETSGKIDQSNDYARSAATILEEGIVANVKSEGSGSAAVAASKPVDLPVISTDQKPLVVTPRVEPDKPAASPANPQEPDKKEPEVDFKYRPSVFDKSSPANAKIRFKR